MILNALIIVWVQPKKINFFFPVMSHNRTSNKISTVLQLC
jgi:hypothetical protein